MPDSGRVSVIVPVYNGEKSIFTCLQSIYSQDRRADVEVVVVDDGSSDSSASIVREGFPAAVLIRTERLGCDGARQAGMVAATGDILANTDADCTVSSTWIAGILEAIEDGSTAVTGPVIHKPQTLTTLVGILDFPDFQSLKKGRISNFPGCNFALRRETIERFGYHTRSQSCGADRLLAWRISSAGGHIAYTPDVTVFHCPSVQVVSLIERRRRYSTVALRIRQSDRSLPGGWLAGLGRLASPVYCAARLTRDLHTLAQLTAGRRVSPLLAPTIAIGAVAIRGLDLLFMLSSSREGLNRPAQ